MVLWCRDLRRRALRRVPRRFSGGADTVATDPRAELFFSHAGAYCGIWPQKRGVGLELRQERPEHAPIASRERSDRSVPSLIMMPLSSTARLTPCCLAPATTFFAQSEMTVPGSRRTLHHVVDRDRL